MRDLQEDITQLTEMRRTLNSDVLHELEGSRGNYVKRLGEVASETFQRPDLLQGTTIQNPGILTPTKTGRLKVVYPKKLFAMYVREIELSNGHFLSFPLKTIGISSENVPIIENDYSKSSYTIAYLPKSQNPYPTAVPSDMKVNLLFTVNADDTVSTNGLHTVTAAEYMLFDSVVCEFENRANATSREPVS